MSVSAMNMPHPCRWKKTAFPMKKNIHSFEWVYDKKLIPIEEFTLSYAQELKEDLKQTYKKLTSRGIMLFLYAGANSQKYIQKAQEIYLAAELEEACVAVRILEDTQEELLRAMRTRRIIASFSKEERAQFERFAAKDEKDAEYKIGKTFVKLSDEHYILGKNGLEKYEKPIKFYCDEKFEKIYSRAVPFVFDGFEKKVDTKVKRYLATICRALLDGTIKNKQSYYAMDRQYQNRVKSALSLKAANSWQVFDEDSCEIVEPQNPLIAQIIEKAEKTVEERQTMLSGLFGRYMSVPYGMNNYSLALLVSYFIAKNRDRAVLFYKGKRVRIADIVQEFIVEKSTTLNIKTEVLLGAEIGFTERTGERPIKLIAKKIKENKYAENCAALSRELERVIMEENCEDEDSGIIEVARIRLNGGAAALKKTNDELMSARDLMQKIKAKFTIGSAWKLCVLIGKKGLIDEGKQYYYSAVHDEECERLKQELLSVIDSNGYDMVKNLNCPVTSLSQLKNTTKRGAEEFRKIGFVKFAEYLEQMVPLIERRVVAKAKHEQNLSDIVRLCAEYKKCAGMNYADAVSGIAELDAKQAYLDALDELDMVVKEKYYNDISAAKEALETRLAKIKDMVSAIYDVMPSVSDLRAVNSLRKRMVDVLALKLDADTESEINDELERVDKFLELRSTEFKTRAELEQLHEDIMRFEGTYLEKLAHDLYLRGESKMDNEEGRWLDRNVERVLPKIIEMKADKCMLWKNDTRRLPGFLSEKGRERYLEAAKLVDLRLRACRIDGIVEMFRALREAEKDECMERLMEIYRK